MNDHQALSIVQTALEAIESLLSASPNPTDDDLREHLRQRGLSSRDAAALVALLPIAFGRAYLQQKGVVSFVNHMRVGKDIRIYLSDQPLYVAGVDVGVTSLHHGTATPRALQLLVNRSVEVRLLSSLIKAGKPLPEAPNIAIGLPADPEGAFIKPA